MKDRIYANRKENLGRLVLERFEGNRAALARAAGVQQNQINLMLSDNEEHRRNMGETLARRMEVSLGLPPGYFDEERRPSVLGDLIRIKAPILPPELAGPLRIDDSLHEVVTYSTWMLSLQGRVTSPANLILCQAATSEAEPAVKHGDHVILDAGVRHITGDGVYVFSHGQGAVMRRIRARIGGGWLCDDGGVSVELPKSVKVLGRVVQVYRAVNV